MKGNDRQYEYARVAYTQETVLRKTTFTVFILTRMLSLAIP